MLMKNCETCGKEFKSYPSQNKRFCSMVCGRRAQKHGYDLNFLDEDTELRSYFLGLFMADGNFSRPEVGRTRKSISITLTDEQIINDLAKRVSYTNKICRITHKDYPTWKDAFSLHFAGKISEKLLEFGFEQGAKTGKEFIPECISDNTFNHFFRGVVDGDGTIVKNFGKQTIMLGICSASKRFLDDLNLKMYKLIGIYGSVLEADPNVEGINVWYNLRYCHSKALPVLDYMYSNATIFLKRKYDRYLAGKKVGVFVRPTRQRDKTCKIEGCNKPCFAKDMCKTHHHYYWQKEYREWLHHSQILKSSCQEQAIS